MASRLIPPVLVTGSTRSGTTIISRILGRAPSLGYWKSEQITLWRVGYAYRDSDFADAKDARPWVRRWIRRTLVRFQDQLGSKRLIEKTPMNVVRLPFIHEIVPEAKIIHMVRHGFDVVCSQFEQFESFEGYNPAFKGAGRHFKSRLAVTPFWEWPAYAPRAFASLWRKHVQQSEGTPWFGLRYPGWRQDRATHSKYEIAAKQWAVACERGLEGEKQLPDNIVLTVRYEDLATQPEKTFRQIFQFLDLNPSDSFLTSAAKTMRPSSVGRWQDHLDEETLETIRPIVAPMLRKLNYHQ